MNRDIDGPREVAISIVPARPGADVQVHTISGSGPGAVNTFEDRQQVATVTRTMAFGAGPTFSADVQALSVNAFVFTL